VSGGQGNAGDGTQTVRLSLSPFLHQCLHDDVCFQNSEKANTVLLRSLCAELETFIDNRGPLLAAPLEFAAAGELEDEEVC
jgi:hypothetical protein